MSSTEGQVSSGLVALFSRRAMYPCWIKFGINKAELSCLSALHAYLEARNKTIVSWLSFKRAVTNNSREKAKMEGYLQGLLKGKFIAPYEYKRVPGSFCVGITPLGLAVLERYNIELFRLSKEFKDSCVPASNVRHEYEHAA